MCNKHLSYKTRNTIMARHKILIALEETKTKEAFIVLHAYKEVMKYW